MGKMLRWTLRKAKTAESFVLLFWKEDSVEFRREQDRPAVGQKKLGVEFCESLRPPLCK
jgi:hypothetical protein